MAAVSLQACSRVRWRCAAVGAAKSARVGRLVVEGDVLPGIERGLQRLARLRGRFEDLRTFAEIVAAFVAREDHRFERDAVRRRAGLDAHRMADRAAAELQDHVFAEIVEQLVHLAGMDAAGGDRHHLVERGPVLIEEHAVLEALRRLASRAACRRSP